MKVIAYYALHYGKEWLYHSIRSIIEHVDEVRVYYSETPSHGHATTLKNPDTAGDLLDICRQFGVVWSESKARFRWEGNHRDYALKDCFNNGADIVMVVDHDEIWDGEHLEKCIQHVKSHPGTIYRVGMVHFWRSVNWICNDPAMPVRFMRQWHAPTEVYIPKEYGLVNHFGYAQRPEIVHYKQDIHGHKAEWRKGWFNDKFMAWYPGMKDVHPTCGDNFWEPEPFNKEQIQHLIGDHPYYDLELIE